MTHIIGLTGGIATGKSTVSKMFQEKGIPVLDADIIAHEVMGKGTPVFKQIVETFGESVVLPNGELDRRKLGEIVFNDSYLREQLNRIVHPAVKDVMLERIRRIDPQVPLVILDVPLLFESGFDSICEQTIVVYTDEKTQLERLKHRNRLSTEDALKRIHAQMPLAEKIKRADVIIDNSRTIDETQKQVSEFIHRIQV